MNKVYLLTGGNMGNRQAMLEQAKNRIQKEIGVISACSEIYETAAWGKADQPSFLNQALEITALLSAREVLSGVLSIEAKMGRFRQEKFGPRIIDIDILLYNNAIINEPGLIIPHARLAGRRFALTPLAEIAPDYVHPILKETIGTLLLNCKDELPVKKLEN
ncbi:MAG: 2-amino-4-hydroxy-6-hydroxymethyldihydropteridine diphosphokinase [Sphingobacteriales bacterium]|nr:2-amino-4-hydroxy-6-hydroxymethyldihydropteridine diphosphokinase [Sphingobacteriales bacterium]OJY90268.1 MAG: 2-amino-4-hydroxy-6-hydroxymethyldihydropteridine diphosphokinase [Sphingobacteriales bacterium 44-15]